MGIFTAIILLLIATGLFVAVQKKIISNETLGVLANIAGIVALLAAIFVFVVPATDSKSSSSNPTQEDAATPTPNFTSQSSIETPTGQVVENTATNWSGILLVRLPTLNEIRAEKPVSLWDDNMIEVQDMHQPGIDNYSGEAIMGVEYLFPIYWCTASSTLLAQSMDFMETQFFVNGEKIPEKYIFSYNFDTNTNWFCNYHAVVLGSWSKGAQYTLDIKRTFSKEVSDGQANYPSGDYVYSLIVKVY
jgi:hypothetical protein